MKKTGLKDHIEYKIDTVMSQGTSSLIRLLGIVTLIAVTVTGLAVVLVEQSWSKGSFPSAMWKSLMLTLDPGNLDGVEGGLSIIFIAAISTLSGIFITSTLISVMNTGLSSRLENLQRGNAKIIEHNHTVILGFNESIFAIINQLQIANKNVSKSCLVILGEEAKQLMEDQIQRRIPYSKNTRIICRNGDVASSVDLQRCSVETSKSVIVNLTDDSQVIRTILAVSNYLIAVRHDFPKGKQIHIAASIKEQENLHIAQIAGQGYAEVLHYNLVISRIMAHVCYQPGLSSVYMELFDFGGDEIYIEAFPQLEGLTFHDAQLSFVNSAVIGIDRGGTCLINPDPVMKLGKDDKLILIASDDGVSVPLESAATFDETDVLLTEVYRKPSAKTLLILGTSSLLADILNELNRFLPPKTKVTIASKYLNKEEMTAKTSHLNELDVNFFQMDFTCRAHLDEILKHGYEHVLILSDRQLANEQSDAKTLSVLLQIREWQKTNKQSFSITTEMLDARNQELARVAKVSDFVISSNITGLITTQIAENRKLAHIISELLDAEGSEIYLKPAINYVLPGQQINLFFLTHLLSSKNEVLIGYKKSALNESGHTGSEIVINPDKNVW